MNGLFSVLTGNLFSLFLLIAVGYAVMQLKWVPKDCPSSISSLLLQVGLPATVFTALIRPYDPNLLKDGAIVCALTAVFYLISALLGLVLAKLCRVPLQRQGAWMISMTFTNGGFMGFPIILALFGTEAFSLAAFTNITWTMFIYSLGVWQLHYGQQEKGKGSAINWKRILITPINISLVIGLAFLLLSITPPASIMQPMQHLANLCTPLSMLLIGMTLAGKSLKEAIRDRDALSGALVRLIPVPLILLLILKLIPFANSMILPVLLMVFAMPSTALGSALADQNGADSELAARITFLSSLFCIITIPLTLLLL